MLRYGEDATTSERVCEVGAELFPKAWHPWSGLYAKFELDQTRKLLAFTRDPCVQEPPSIRSLLTPLLTKNNYGNNPMMDEVRNNYGKSDQES